MPFLVDGRRSEPGKAWSIGDARDAVALAAALKTSPAITPEAGDALDKVRLFASDLEQPNPVVSFPLRDLGYLPAPERRTCFHRNERRWVPDERLAESVLLTRPVRPVDVATARDQEGMLRARDRLQSGGILVTAELLDATPKGLHRDPAEPRLFHKVGRDPDLATAEPAETTWTLAETQRRQRLIESHAALARSIARRFAHRGVPLQDLEQVAMIALVNAAHRYDTGRDTAFATFARSTITGEIKRYFRDRTWMVRVPRSLKERYVEVKDARDELSSELSTAPTTAQVAARVGCSETEVHKALDVADAYTPGSLDVPVSEDEPNTEVAVIDPAFDHALDKHRLRAVLPLLEERQLLIIRRLFFEGRTQQELAEELDVSQMQVSRLRADTIARIRKLDAAGAGAGAKPPPRA